MLPSRTTICVSCRTCLMEGESCDEQCNMLLLSLVSPEDRGRLVNGAWEHGMVRFSGERPPTNYGPLKIPALSSGAGLVLLVSGVAGGAIASALVILPWLLVPFLAGRSSRRLSSSVRSQTSNVRSRHRGVVSKSQTKYAPASGRDCIGFRVQLNHGNSDSDSLVDACSHGFHIDLEDGRTVYIPEGRIRLEGDSSTLSFPRDTHMLDWWPQIDPNRASDDPYPPYPHDRIKETVIRPGDRLLLQNELFVTTRQQRGGSYRDMSNNILEPRGVPRLKLLKA